MHSDEMLQAASEDLDKALFACLDNLGASSEKFQELFTEAMVCTQRYTQALQAAAETAPLEIAEHYRQSSLDTIDKVKFFLMVLIRYHESKGLE